MENVSWEALPQRAIFHSSSLQTKEESNNESIKSNHFDHNEVGETKYFLPTPTEETESLASDTQQLNDLSGYEYLDHTADVQIHCWGNSWETAFAAAGLALFGYMTDLKAVHPDPALGAITVRAQGHDLYSLLYKFLDECLFLYGANYIILCQLQVTSIQLDDTFQVEAVGQGEVFDPNRHSQGTEIKAITYSAMQITEEETGRIHMYFIVDI